MSTYKYIYSSTIRTMLHALTCYSPLLCTLCSILNALFCTCISSYTGGNKVIYIYMVVSLLKLPTKISTYCRIGIRRKLPPDKSFHTIFKMGLQTFPHQFTITNKFPHTIVTPTGVPQDNHSFIVTKCIVWCNLWPE